MGGRPALDLRARPAHDGPPVRHPALRRDPRGGRVAAVHLLQFRQQRVHRILLLPQCAGKAGDGPAGDAGGHHAGGHRAHDGPPARDGVRGHRGPRSEGRAGPRRERVRGRRPSAPGQQRPRRGRLHRHAGQRGRGELRDDRPGGAGHHVRAV